jgi:hypothetical protein
MEIHVKTPKERADHPTRQRWWKDGLKTATRRQKTMKFENAAEETDYRKMVNRNPNNIYGLPAFYPAIEIKSFVGEGISEEDWKRIFGDHPRSELRIDDRVLFCDSCHKRTIHAISESFMYCRKCGTQKGGTQQCVPT